MALTTATATQPPTDKKPKILQAFDRYMEKYHSPDPARPGPDEQLPPSKDEVARRAAEDEAAHHQQRRRRI